MKAFAHNYLLMLWIRLKGHSWLGSSKKRSVRLFGFHVLQQVKASISINGLSYFAFGMSVFSENQTRRSPQECAPAPPAAGSGMEGMKTRSTKQLFPQKPPLPQLKGYLAPVTSFVIPPFLHHPPTWRLNCTCWHTSHQLSLFVRIYIWLKKAGVDYYELTLRLIHRTFAQPWVCSRNLFHGGQTFLCLYPLHSPVLLIVPIERHLLAVNRIFIML